MAAALLRGPGAGAAAAMARRWPAPSGGVLRFAPLATSRVPASLARGSISAGVASKPLTAMCMKAEYTSSPVDPNAVTEHAEDENQQPTTVSPTNTEMDIDQEAVPQHKGAIIHDFCLGIPFGAILFSMGLVGFLFWRSTVSLTFGVAPGLAILALGVLSLKVWRSGKSSLPFILAQAAVASAVAWKHFQAYTTTKKLLPWGFYIALSAAMICFYSYVVLAGGNPPPKKKAAVVQ
ncbi:protein FATTY ACID EXPORT 1, chloroplastic-like [Oryza brachyantha]|uniref:protein FATTY ACID EXPORT 1, chloroplastic-like n=1 Tax=Oryza brachyantha TaxID=4533 RepID=UPI0003EA8F0D|nr:protein FATTY ACID EXPORT 1, chloroplastic-like [Oryza brachyantha]